MRLVVLGFKLHSQCDPLSVSLEAIDVVVDPLERHGHVEEAVVAWRMVVAGRQKAQGSQAVVDSDDHGPAPGGQLVARELVARAVRELAAVDVEHHGEQLGLARVHLGGKTRI